MPPPEREAGGCFAMKETRRRRARAALLGAVGQEDEEAVAPGAPLRVQVEPGLCLDLRWRAGTLVIARPAECSKKLAQPPDDPCECSKQPLDGATAKARSKRRLIPWISAILSRHIPPHPLRSRIAQSKWRLTNPSSDPSSHPTESHRSACTTAFLAQRGEDAQAGAAVAVGVGEGALPAPAQWRP